MYCFDCVFWTVFMTLSMHMQNDNKELFKFTFFNEMFGIKFYVLNFIFVRITTYSQLSVNNCYFYLFILLFFFQHSEQTYYGSSGFVRNSESGFFIINLDRRVHEIDKVIPEMAEAEDISSRCKELFCGIPFKSWKLAMST